MPLTIEPNTDKNACHYYGGFLDSYLMYIASSVTNSPASADS